MNKAYLLLGSNLGNSKEKLLSAQAYIGKKIGTVTRSSSLYQTAAWGKTDQPDFINQVLIVQTELSATETMDAILLIEEEMGRVRSEKNAARIIDIDILFFNREVIHTQKLSVPHPQIQNRRFVLVPLAALSPRMMHPGLHKSITQLLTECSDPLDVKKI